jgi:hypothetical protein
MSFASKSTQVIWFISIQISVNSAKEAFHWNICTPYQKINQNLTRSINALGKSLAMINHLLSFLSQNMIFEKYSLIACNSFVILLFCSISNFDIINLTIDLSVWINISLLFFLILSRRLFPNHANITIIINTITTIKSIHRHKLMVIMVNIIKIFVINLTHHHNRVSFTIDLWESTHFWMMLFDCPVPNHSILLLSDLMYFSK